jgi:uncharacterized protein YxeA
MKKIIAVIAIAVLAAVFSATAAFAHGHQGGAAAVCKIESCTKSGQHKHSGTYYKAHYYGDGHRYHGYCSVSNCTKTGYHKHGGSYCFSHTSNDGHSHSLSSGNHRQH